MRQAVDASVILAFLLNEPGCDAMTNDDGPFCLSSVNLTEVLTKVIDRGLVPDDVLSVLKRLPVEHHHHCRDDALRAANLRPKTRHLGLSLGDRACLALAQRLDIPALTADFAWKKLDIAIEIVLIR